MGAEVRAEVLEVGEDVGELVVDQGDLVMPVFDTRAATDRGPAHRLNRAALDIGRRRVLVDAGSVLGQGAVDVVQRGLRRLRRVTERVVGDATSGRGDQGGRVGA